MNENEEAPLAWQERAPGIGFISGSCGVSLLALIVCAIASGGSSGGGSPLFWPLLMVLCGFIGWVVGMAIKSTWRDRHHPD